MSTSENIQRSISFISGNRSASISSSVASDPESSDGENGERSPIKRRRAGSLLRRSDNTREHHLRQLVSERNARQQYLSKLMRRDSLRGSVLGGENPEVHSSPQLGKRLRKGKSNGIVERYVQARENEQLKVSTTSAVTTEYELTDAQKEQMQKMSESMIAIKRKLEEYRDLSHSFPIEIRIDNLTYTVPVTSSSNKIKTVYNSSIIYKLVKLFKRVGNSNAAENGSGPTSKVILDRISLLLKPGRMYLLLGPPSSGKTSLLKAIAGRLSTKDGEKKKGRVTYNGRSFEDKNNFHIENVIAYIDQLDRHAPRLTVDETFEFAFQCKNGGSHVQMADFSGNDETVKFAKIVAKHADEERLMVNLNLQSLGLDTVRDTFVGDDEIRGVSGGQRRRVTVGEMMLGATPVFLGDEISNGLDASSTFEMIQILTQLSKDYQRTRVISLLQPSPETVALFDEIILLAEGKVLFAGPIAQVEDYFSNLGYKPPPYMDVADFLQLLSTPADCEMLFHPAPEISESQPKPYGTNQLAELFRESVHGESIRTSLRAPHQRVWGSAHGGINVTDEVDHLDDRKYHRKYMNSLLRSVMLNVKRNLTLWIRDRRVLIANAVKNIIMGISVGGVFFQTDDVVSVLGVLFQGMLFIMLGAMTTAPGFVDERIIYYKQAESNFFSSYPYVIGKAMSKLPQVNDQALTYHVMKAARLIVSLFTRR